MLSKLFNSARNLFNPTLQTNFTEEPLEKNPNTEMVTTRGQTGKNASQEEISGKDSVVVDMPRSSRKRSRKVTEQEDVEVADKEVILTPAKKQKVLPLREKDEDRPRNTRVVVEIPVSSIPVEFRGVKEDVESAEEEEGTEEAEVERLEISDSESDGESEAEEPIKPAVSSKKKKTTATPSPNKSQIIPASVKPKHKRFGSEEQEPEPELFSTAVEIIESDEESSDGDAPEVVGAQEALKSAQSKARDVAKAVEE
jgi:U3 small nucleolar RNA-associated protein 16